MQKIKQDTISITTVEIYDKRTLSKVYESKTFESDSTKAEKEVLSDSIRLVYSQHQKTSCHQWFSLEPQCSHEATEQICQRIYLNCALGVPF